MFASIVEKTISTCGIMTDAVLFSLDDLVGDQLQPVSYKWLARHFNVPYDTSKRILFQYLSKNREVRQSRVLFDH